MHLTQSKKRSVRVSSRPFGEKAEIVYNKSLSDIHNEVGKLLPYSEDRTSSTGMLFAYPSIADAVRKTRSGCESVFNKYVESIFLQGFSAQIKKGIALGVAVVVTAGSIDPLLLAGRVRVDGFWVEVKRRGRAGIVLAFFWGENSNKNNNNSSKSARTSHAAAKTRAQHRHAVAGRRVRIQHSLCFPFYTVPELVIMYAGRLALLRARPLQPNKIKMTRCFISRGAVQKRRGAVVVAHFGTPPIQSSLHPHTTRTGNADHQLTPTINCCD